MDEYEPIRDSERAEAHVTYYYVRPEQPRQYGSNAPAPKPAAGGRPAPPPPSEPAAGGSAAGPSTGEDAAPPPSYSEIVQGDHKVQTQD